MRFTASTLIAIQGFTWFAIGIFLLCKGVLLTTILLAFPQLGSLVFEKGAPLIGGGANAVVLIICFGLICGWLKARYVLIHVIRKSVYRLTKMNALIPLKKIYGVRYYLIVAMMISFGIILRSLGLKNDIYGLIAIVIGSALLNGSFLTFRFALELRRII